MYPTLDQLEEIRLWDLICIHRLINTEDKMIIYLTDPDDIAGLLDGHDNPRLLVELRGPHGRDHDICTLDGIYEAPVVK